MEWYNRPFLSHDTLSNQHDFPFYSKRRLTVQQPHLENIGLNQIEISVTLLSGLFCGAFLQPIFGSWSDRVQRRWGRRKPFILAGSLSLILSLLSLAWASSISGLLVSPSASQLTQRQSLVTVTMVSFMAVWVAIQPVQIGLRTLITDDCSESEQSKANARASTHINLAAVLSNLAAFTRILPSKGSDSVFQGLSLLASIALIITIGISCVSIEEKIADLSAGLNIVTASHSTSLRVVWRLLVIEPSPIRTVYLVQFFAWLGWFPSLYYAVTYDFHKLHCSNLHLSTNFTETLNRYVGSLRKCFAGSRNSSSLL